MQKRQHQLIIGERSEIHALFGRRYIQWELNSLFAMLNLS